jgi:hypothetical protein
MAQLTVLNGNITPITQVIYHYKPINTTVKALRAIIGKPTL